MTAAIRFQFSKSQKYTFLSLELCSGGRRAKRADRQPKNGKNKICQKISPKKIKICQKIFEKNPKMQKSAESAWLAWEWKIRTT